MDKIFEDIYEEVSLSNKYKPSEIYWELIQKEHLAFQKLKFSLSKRQQILLERFIDCNNKRVSLEIKEKFIAGLKTGLNINKH